MLSVIGATRAMKYWQTAPTKLIVPQLFFPLVFFFFSVSVAQSTFALLPSGPFFQCDDVSEVDQVDTKTGWILEYRSKTKQTFNHNLGARVIECCCAVATVQRSEDEVCGDMRFVHTKCQRRIHTAIRSVT